MNDLTAFAVGKLVSLRTAIVEHHVARCDQCAAVLADSPRDDFVERLRDAERPLIMAGTDTPARHAPAQCLTPDLGEVGLDQLPPALRQHPRFRVIRLLAEGGMGAVYLAEHRIMRTLVALKTIRPELAENRHTIARFLQEARIAGRLAHPHIARILDAEQLGPTLVIAIEFIPGKTLGQLVTNRGPLPLSEACRWIRQAALALQYASDEGTVHRDVKPQNIVVESSTGMAKVLDFGLGRLVEEQRSRPGLTRDDEILGTPQYMAPEQARHSQSADIRADIYSLGCTFYCLLAGEPPFQGDTALELFNQHETVPPPSIAALCADVPPAVHRLIDRMLAKDPIDRPQTPREVAAALAQFDVDSRDYSDAGSDVSAPAEEEASPADRGLAIVRALRSPAVALPLATVMVCLVLLLFF